MRVEYGTGPKTTVAETDTTDGETVKDETGNADAETIMDESGKPSENVQMDEEGNKITYYYDEIGRLIRHIKENTDGTTTETT